MVLPPVEESTYTRSKNGYFGQLGRGANAEIKFIQTAITREELDSITLIQNIPGSEKWEVRDLFQRDVDQDRVTNDILPYLKDKDRVKFFNPLTIALLPIEEGGDQIIRELSTVEQKEEEVQGHRYEILALEPFFQFRVHATTPSYSSLWWNDQRVKLVAIDGQHRLSALKRWKNEGASRELAEWRIPVVILGIFKSDASRPAATVLEIVRKTFIYINSKAEEVNEARAILLNDESVNCLCVQELVQTAHSNDTLPFEARRPGRVPLLFFDWRGEVRDHVRRPAPAALKKIEEVYLWFEQYLLGQDGTNTQEAALTLDDLVPPLENFGEDRTLSHEDARRVRGQFRDTMLPGLLEFLEGFRPYADYIGKLRDIEERALRESDLSEHAFMKLRFGNSRASDDIRPDVDQKYGQLVDELIAQKDQDLPELVRLDIGMRGLMSAFAEGKAIYDNLEGETVEWTEYARWFTKAANAVFADGWFASFSDQEAEKRRHLTYVAYDDVGTIVNYRPADVPDALGVFLLLQVFRKGEGIDQERLSETWEDHSERLKAPLRKGFRKHFRSALQETFNGTPKEFRAEVNRKAEAAVTKRIDKLRSFLGVG